MQHLTILYFFFATTFSTTLAQWGFGLPAFGQQQQQQRQVGYNPGNFFFPGQQPLFSNQNYQNNQNPQNYNQNNQRPTQNTQNQRPSQNPQNNQNQRPSQNPPNNQNQRPSQNPPNNQYRPPPPPQRPPQNPVNPNERISQRKCREYSKVLSNSVVVASLSLDSSFQDINVDSCDASTGLVVGGEDAKKGEFPHMAALGYPEGLEDSVVAFKCGGTLVSEKYVLTAAHCKKADRKSPVVVRLGDLNLKVREADLPETDVPIVRFISHENYNRQTSQNDIALVQMDRNVQFSKLLRPACLPNPSINLKSKAVASGWGFTEVGGQTANHLQKVELGIIDNQRCLQLYEGQAEYNIIDSQICAGELAGGKDTCQGDSGGPLQVTANNNKCMYVVIGVTSYGPTFCGSANQPGIYTRVSSYIDWIEQKIWS